MVYGMVYKFLGNKRHFLYLYFKNKKKKKKKNERKGKEMKGKERKMEGEHKRRRRSCCCCRKEKECHCSSQFIGTLWSSSVKVAHSVEPSLPVLVLFLLETSKCGYTTEKSCIYSGVVN